MYIIMGCNLSAIIDVSTITEYEPKYYNKKSSTINEDNQINKLPIRKKTLQTKSKIVEVTNKTNRLVELVLSQHSHHSHQSNSSRSVSNPSNGGQNNSALPPPNNITPTSTNQRQIPRRRRQSSSKPQFLDSLKQNKFRLSTKSSRGNVFTSFNKQTSKELLDTSNSNDTPQYTSSMRQSSVGILTGLISLSKTTLSTNTMSVMSSTSNSNITPYSRGHPTPLSGNTPILNSNQSSWMGNSKKFDINSPPNSVLGGVNNSIGLLRPRAHTTDLTESTVPLEDQQNNNIEFFSRHSFSSPVQQQRLHQQQQQQRSSMTHKLTDGRISIMSSPIISYHNSPIVSRPITPHDIGATSAALNGSNDEHHHPLNLQHRLYQNTMESPILQSPGGFESDSTIVAHGKKCILCNLEFGTLDEYKHHKQYSKLHFIALAEHKKHQQQKIEQQQVLELLRHEVHKQSQSRIGNINSDIQPRSNIVPVPRQK